jgi:hypothetical protein
MRRMAISSRARRSLLFSFIVSLCMCGAIGIYTLVFGKFSWLEVQVLLTTCEIGGASILAMVGAIAWDTRRWHPLGPIAMIVVVIALLMLISVTWGLRPDIAGDLYEKLTFSVCIAAVALPHICLLSLARLHRGFEWVRFGTIGVIVALAAIILWIVLTPAGGDEWMRLIGVLAIVDACGTIAVPILHRVSGIAARERVVTTDLSLSVTCPRCAKTQTLPTGLSRCECGLKIRIEIEEEHCRKCGYSLYKAASGVCPECGTQFA